MARFSKECMYRMWSVTKNLERSLGPDTGDVSFFFNNLVTYFYDKKFSHIFVFPKKLTMRMGLHSGPVTGGVLRGEKARFQLFGDTVNTGKHLFCLYDCL